MCRCIYCNSDDLSVSDIISYALTGAKITKKFVCHEHNKFTNDNYEKKAIANLDFLRSSLGLTERKGTEIKYKGTMNIDGISIPNVWMTRKRSSIYEDKKRIFHAEHNGKKVLIGSIDKLKQIKGVKENEIEILDMSNFKRSVEFSLKDLFASEEMLRTVSKIAYEWYCYIQDINKFECKKYKDIVDCVLLEKPVENFVEICVDNTLDYALGEVCNPGDNGLFVYEDIDGYKYVVFDFWGIVCYKIRIGKSTDFHDIHMYKLFIYGIDGRKSEEKFSIIGTPSIISMPAVDAMKVYKTVFTQKLFDLTSITTLSLERVKQEVNELEKTFRVYKKEPHDFDHFIDYENSDIINTISLILFLYTHKTEYSFENNFAQNLKKLYKTEDKIIITPEKKKAYVTYLLQLHEENKLVNCIENGISFFKEICVKEI